MYPQQFTTRMRQAKKAEKFGDKYNLLRKIQADLKDESVKKLLNLAETFSQLAYAMKTLKKETEKEFTRDEV